LKPSFWAQKGALFRPHPAVQPTIKKLSFAPTQCCCTMQRCVRPGPRIAFRFRGSEGRILNWRVPSQSRRKPLDRESLRAKWIFARSFLKHPVMLGSLIPSSKTLVTRLAQQVNWDKTRIVVEYGPGVGTITTEILRRLPPDGVLVAIDYNQDFANYLSTTLKDPRLLVAHGSAADVEQILAGFGLEGADCVFSGIPHSTLSAEMRSQIFESTRRVLRPGGTFIVYQFTGAVLPQLRQVFGEVDQHFEPLNILPARIFCCSR